MHTPLTDKQKREGYVQEYLEVQQLFDENQEGLNLLIIAGDAGLDRRILNKELHRPGLALAGFLELFTYDRVQVLGNTEIQYLKSLQENSLIDILRKVFNFKIPCFIFSNGNEVPEHFRNFADEFDIPVFQSDLTTTEVYHLLSVYLEAHFAPHITVHGSLVDVYGTGMLITGRSGIGKSEIALDLVERGHRLVADDSVKLEKKAEGILSGSSPEIIRHMIEIRGLGLVDVRRMFGVRAIRVQKRVEVEVRLMEWDDNVEWERIGLDTEYTKFLGVEIPLIKLPIFPGKNITMIAEVIALNNHLKVYGINAAEEMTKRIQDAMDRKKIKKYLYKDYE